MNHKLLSITIASLMLGSAAQTRAGNTLSLAKSGNANAQIILGVTSVAGIAGTIAYINRSNIVPAQKASTMESLYKNACTKMQQEIFNNVNSYKKAIGEEYMQLSATLLKANRNQAKIPAFEVKLYHRDALENYREKFDYKIPREDFTQPHENENVDAYVARLKAQGLKFLETHSSNYRNASKQ